MKIIFTILVLCLLVSAIVLLVYLIKMFKEDIKEEIYSDIRLGNRCVKCHKKFDILEHKHNLNKSPIYDICVCDKCYEKYYNNNETTNE